MLKKFASLLVVAIAMLAARYIYERKSNEQLREQFSYNLNKWFEKGNYYVYQDRFRVFYVQEVLRAEDQAEDVHIVLLHGFPTSSYDYSKLWPQLRQTSVKSIVSFDFVGYGFSDKPDDFDYSLFSQADLVDSFLMHLGSHRTRI